jgi:hypothetical protein
MTAILSCPGAKKGIGVEKKLRLYLRFKSGFWFFIKIPDLKPVGIN